MAKANPRMFQNKKLKFFIIGTKVDCSNSHSLRSFGRLRGVSKIIYQNLLTTLQNRHSPPLILVIQIIKLILNRVARERFLFLRSETFGGTAEGC